MLFGYGFQDIQLGSFALAGSISLRNAARAAIYGIDVDFEVAPTSRLRLSGSAEWLHARFTSFPGAPAAVPLPTGGHSRSEERRFVKGCGSSVRTGWWPNH